jgi:ankyrin repeat protein
LCNSKHSLDTFWFLLQVCGYLLEAVKSGDVNRTKIFLKCANENCTTDDAYHYTPLKIAVRIGNEAVVRVLLEGGANADRTNAFQPTALHSAANYGYLNVCRVLLDWGAKVNPVDKWKDTPLHYAAWAGHLSVVKLLVERGADVRLRNGKGLTASEAARSKGKKDVADWLDSVSSG